MKRRIFVVLAFIPIFSAQTAEYPPENCDCQPCLKIDGHDSILLNDTASQGDCTVNGVLAGCLYKRIGAEHQRTCICTEKPDDQFDNLKEARLGDCWKTEDFQVVGLELHNKYRSLHGVSNLTLDEELCRLAQEWADISVLEEQNPLPKRPYNPRDIWYWQSQDSMVFYDEINPVAQMQILIDHWYGESTNFNFTSGRVFQTGDLQSPVEHFTAMIWKASKILGIGLARSTDLKRMVLVAYYFPPGNKEGSFVENVPKSIKQT